MLGNNAQSTAGLYTDFGGLNKLRANASQHHADADKEVADQFEALFLQMMLKSMRQGEGKGLMDSAQSDMARGLYDQQLALHLSEQGAIGIGDMLLQQIRGQKGEPQTEISTDAEQANLESYRKTALPVQFYAATGSVKNKTEIAPEQSVTNNQSEPDWVTLLGEQQATEKAKTQPHWLAPAPAPTYQPSELPLSFKTPKSFVNSLMPAAENAARKLGTAPQAILAIAALETGWGKHTAKKVDGTASNNLFGIKANSQWQGEQVRAKTLEFEGGAMQQRVEPFRSYNSPAESVADFADFIIDNPRYQAALDVAHDPEQFIKEIHQAGYATDPNYSKKVTGVMNNVFEITQEGWMVADNQ